MSTEVLKAEKLVKIFTEPARQQVLYDVGLSVGKGQFVAIMGKSGCGKSTLLYLLSTLDTDYEGVVTIMGRTVTGLGEDKLAKFRNEHIGFVFQSHFLLPEFTALENVMLPALKLGRWDPATVERRALDRLKQVDMDGFAHQPSGKLSGGQQQRVAIARALVNEPDLILADEPTGNLDSINTEKVIGIFRELAQQGNTIIVVTHDRDLADRADRIIELADGRIVG
jgi:lipoprotein-releasing system ATP-binding protein